MLITSLHFSLQTVYLIEHVQNRSYSRQNSYLANLSLVCTQSFAITIVMLRYWWRCRRYPWSRVIILTRVGDHGHVDPTSWIPCCHRRCGGWTRLGHAKAFCVVASQRLGVAGANHHHRHAQEWVKYRVGSEPGSGGRHWWPLGISSGSGGHDLAGVMTERNATPPCCYWRVYMLKPKLKLQKIYFHHF